MGESEDGPAVKVAEAKEATSMRFWISFILGLMTYYLLGRSIIHEGITIIATLVVMAAAYLLYGLVVKEPGNK